MNNYYSKTEQVKVKSVRILFLCADFCKCEPLLDMNTSPYVADFNTTGILGLTRTIAEEAAAMVVVAMWYATTCTRG